MRLLLIIFVLIIFFNNSISFSQSNDETVSNYYPSNELYEGSWNSQNIKDHELIFKTLKIDTVINLFTDSADRYCIPVKGKFLSPYGPRGSRNHSGIDIKLNLGDSVYSVFNGIVRIAKAISGYGNVVVIRHYNGLETLYAHLSKIIVNNDQEIKAGEVIGLGGRTGRATTTHLHFETRFLTKAFNPANFIDIESYNLLTDSLRISCNIFNNCIGNFKDDDELEPHLENEKIISNNNSSPKFHTINKGDTLYNIAKKNQTTVSYLCELNGINTNKTLHVGSKIRVK